MLAINNLVKNAKFCEKIIEENTRKLMLNWDFTLYQEQNRFIKKMINDLNLFLRRMNYL